MRRCAVLLPLVLVFAATAWGYHISDVTISPTSPTTATPVKVTVTGYAPATNCPFDHATLWTLGTMYFLDLYWTSSAGIGSMALVPYSHDESIGLLPVGKYVVYVRTFCDGLLEESKSVSFTVSQALSLNWPTLPSLFGNSWWWPNMNSPTVITAAQVQTLALSPGQISIDVILKSSITPQQ